jgi:LPXTG-site transpeptidase (sortase) family protein
MDKETQQNVPRAVKINSVILYTLGNFLLLTSFLFAIDFVPERTVSEAHQEPTITTQQTPVSEVDTVEMSSTTNNTTTEVQASVEYIPVQESNVPTQIIVKSIGVDTPVIAPASNSNEILDRALLLGAVHYPDSGQLGENANVLIFGHSSHLPVIHNSAYKAFNEINTLENGEQIIVRSESHEYTYEVIEVVQRKAEEARIFFESDQPTLTLATCNNFGSKEDRWIVTAILVSTKQLVTS